MQSRLISSAKKDKDQLTSEVGSCEGIRMPAAVDGLKECTQCGKTKPVSEFNKNRTYKDGLRYECRSCHHKRYHNVEKKEKYKQKWRKKQPAAVYKIENKITNKIYIGQSTVITDRISEHKTTMRRGAHRNPFVQADCDEYGIESFEFSIIQEYPANTSREILFEHEQRLIDQYLAEGKEVYNINRGN